MNYHNPVMLAESVEGLQIIPGGRYVDVTFGGGGHSAAILEILDEEGRLVAFDQDPDALQNVPDDSRFQLVQQNFSYLKNYLRLYGMIPIDGLLADLGVSSHQFDVPERGFSFRFDGPLDMRMDQKRQLTAQAILQTYEEAELARVFWEYGELRSSRRLAAAVVKQRGEVVFDSVAKLRELVRPFVPKAQEHKFMAQLFQALRIEVNGEMEVLKTMLEQAVEVLKVGGRLSIITYHSLEDRLVKNFFRSGNFSGTQEKDLYGNLIRPLEPVNRKAMSPSSDEIKQNNRARSAKLRVAEKIGNGKPV